MSTELNATSLDTLCAALCYAMGIEAPAQAAPANQVLCDYVDKTLNGKKVDRILMYNPDAIAQWIEEKYPDQIVEVRNRAEVDVPMRAVMPSVTPVCFGTMYTGAQPEVHGIQKYTKPVITIDTIFDALIRAGKKCAILGDTKCSLCHIFLDREMDYFPCENVAEINAKAIELIEKDEHDFIVVYNGNYDAKMHKYSPEGTVALGELRANSHAFALLYEMVKKYWTGHDTLVGFGMDHGCHAIVKDGELRGTHADDSPEDRNIVHLYKIHPAEE